jgi:hypothetical protein
MEEDGGQIGQIALDKSNEFLSACAANNPWCAAGTLGTAIAQSLNLGRDTDDYIGSFTMTLTRGFDGRVNTQFNNLVRCSVVDSQSYPQGAMISFVGDGSQYVGLFQFEFSVN